MLDWRKYCLWLFHAKTVPKNTIDTQFCIASFGSVLQDKWVNKFLLIRLFQVCLREFSKFFSSVAGIGPKQAKKAKVESANSFKFQFCS